jgi:hypothetical protein
MACYPDLSFDLAFTLRRRSSGQIRCQTDPTGCALEPQGDANAAARCPVEGRVSLVKGQNVPPGASLKTRMIGNGESLCH